MEALVPGSFQENVSEVYRLNGLRTVKLPTPPMAVSVMEACREVFRRKIQSRNTTGSRTRERRHQYFTRFGPQG